MKANTRFGSIVAATLLLIAFLIVNCESSGPKFDPIEITGQIVDARTDDPVPNAIVRLVEPSPEKTTVTDGQGRFLFELDVDSTVTVRIIVGKEGYQDQNISTVAIPERNISFPITKLVAEGDETDPPVNGDPDDVEAGSPASITLSSLSGGTITVKETGGVEQANFVFAVADSSGIPVPNVEVMFQLGAAPGGGETLDPARASTDENGQVRTTLSSGTVSGVVQVIASVDGGDIVLRSRPINISIQSGLPSFDYFTLFSPSPANIDVGGSSQISVMLGDRYGNPVASGTRVYFTTTHGVVEASAVTGANGVAQTTLRRGEPIPGDGFLSVTARTADENDQTIEKSATLLFMSPPIQIEVTPTEFDIELLGDQTFNYTVTDNNGNPLPRGSSITVTAEGEDIEVIGDVNTSLEDHLSGGQGITNFSFNVAGVNEEPNPIRRPVFITIRASTPSGNVSTVQLQGRKEKTVQ